MADSEKDVENKAGSDAGEPKKRGTSRRRRSPAARAQTEKSEAVQTSSPFPEVPSQEEKMPVSRRGRKRGTSKTDNKINTQDKNNTKTDEKTLKIGAKKTTDNKNIIEKTVEKATENITEIKKETDNVREKSVSKKTSGRSKSGNKKNTDSKNNTPKKAPKEGNDTKKNTDNADRDKKQNSLSSRSSRISQNNGNKKNINIKNTPENSERKVSGKQIENDSNKITDNKKDTESVKTPENNIALEKDAQVKTPEKNSQEASSSSNIPAAKPSTSRSRGHRGGRRRHGSASGVAEVTSKEEPVNAVKPDEEKVVAAPVTPPTPTAPAPSVLTVPPAKPEPQPRQKRRRGASGRKANPYAPTDFSSVEMMSSLKGFAPLGMIFVLMDILKGHEEGLIHVNQLAQALDIGKPSLFAQIENLEAAGLLRTISSSRAGRHIELLTPNLLRHSAMDIFPSGASGNLLAPAKDAPEKGGQFSQKRLDLLHRHLKEHGIEVVSIPDESNLPSNVAQIASFLGKYFSYIQSFYDTLKSRLGDGAEFSYSLAQKASRHITHTLNFCKMLKAAGFLASFEYRRSQQRSIVARVNRTSAALNFLSGGWLEHYIRDKVISILTTHPATLSLPYAFLKNPNVILPGGEHFELDFLLCVGERIFWFEAKTGDYMAYLPKYSRVAKLMGLGRTTSMLVSVNALTPDDNLTARYNLSCCNMDEFPDVFRINLVQELQQVAVQSVS